MATGAPATVLAPTSYVVRSYLLRVLLALFGAPVIAQGLVWFVENVTGQRGHASGYFVVTMLLGWTLACVGTVVLARRFHDDRAELRGEAARGWNAFSVFALVVAWLPVVVVLVVAFGLALGFSGARS